MADRPVRELPEVLQFMQLLWAVVHGVQRTSKRMTAEIGVTGPQRLVLRVVGLSPGMSAGELAAVLHVHPSTLTGVLQRLGSRRLLARAPDARDRRRAVLRLTPRGVRANAVGRGTVEAAVAEALAGISAGDRATARRVLERLAAHLEGVVDEHDEGGHDEVPSHPRFRRAGARLDGRRTAADAQRASVAGARRRVVDGDD